MDTVRTRRVFVSTLLALAVVLPAAAAPAAAALPDRGARGAQAECRYKSTKIDGWAGGMRLNRLTVQPPTLYAATEDIVGWRILVQRRYDNGTWKRTFASVIKRAPATPTQAAALSPLSAHINSPQFIPDGKGGYLGASYRVVLRFYWYSAQGTLLRTERHQVGFYDVMRDGAYMWTDPGSCYHSWIFP
jgi:hypothetical protein